MITQTTSISRWLHTSKSLLSTASRHRMRCSSWTTTSRLTPYSSSRMSSEKSSHSILSSLTSFRTLTRNIIAIRIVWSPTTCSSTRIWSLNMKMDLLKYISTNRRSVGSATKSSQHLNWGRLRQLSIAGKILMINRRTDWILRNLSKKLRKIVSDTYSPITLF